MTIHVLVEGSSERAFLEGWSARLLSGHPVRVHPHQGKGSLPAVLEAAPDPKRRGLLDLLPATLRGYAEALDSTKDGVIVLVDADDDDPVLLHATIAEAVASVAPSLRVIVSIAVEETEAFYLGDLKGLLKAFPEADMNLARTYEPDSICGTAELFGRVVRDGGNNKVAWAEAMAPCLTTVPARSRSPSFKSLVASMTGLLPKKAAAAKRRRKYRHVARTARN